MKIRIGDIIWFNYEKSMVKSIITKLVITREKELVYALSYDLSTYEVEISDIRAIQGNSLELLKEMETAYNAIREACNKLITFGRLSIDD